MAQTEQKDTTSPWKRFWQLITKIAFASLEIMLHGMFSLVYGGSGNSMPPIKDLILLESATSLALKIRLQKVTAVQVMESFIARIKEVNPILNCVVADRFEEALKEAQSVDKLIQSNVANIETLAKQKPFLGVPFTTKDCISVKDMIHTSGLVKRKNNIASEDAQVIAHLRNAGAIPIALTNVSELCMWWESANNVHGRTNNPYNTNHIVGGSSGGEGCAQAAAVSAFGIGSDIGGSIRMPAFFNGVFGHKPSPLIVSNHGQFPETITDEQERFLGLGPICRRAEDLLPLLKTILDNKNANYDKLQLDKAVDVGKMRYFYQDCDTEAYCVSPVAAEIKELFPKIVTHFQKAHTVKMTKLKLTRFGKSAPMWLANMKTPNGPSFQDQLANLNGTINPYWEIAKWFVGLSDHTFIALATALAQKTGCTYGDAQYDYFVQERDNLRRELLDLMGNDGVFIYPTHPTAAPYHNEPIVKPFNFSYTAVINVLGLPATHCPMGLDRNGLPIGVQVVAAEGNDRLCLAVAVELEKAFGGWVPPAIQV